MSIVIILSLHHPCLECNEHIQCRSFDYDSQSSSCPLFESNSETGQIISTNTSSARVWMTILSAELYAGYGKPCEQCITNRYLLCSVNQTCGCPSHTYWNGSLCINQRYQDEPRQIDDWCRTDFGYLCSELKWCRSMLFFMIFIEPSILFLVMSFINVAI